MLRIVVDTDELLRQFVLQLQIQYAKDFPDDWTKEVTGYALDPFFQIGKGIVPYFNEYRAQEIYENAPPFDGAKLFVEELRKNHEVWVASNQKQGNEIYTLKWYEKHAIEYDGLAFTRDKHLIKCDILIDDCTDNLLKAQRAKIVPIAIARPWNTDWKGARAKSFKEILTVISQIEDLDREATFEL